MQTSYNVDMQVAVPGMLTGIGNRTIVSRVAYEEIPCGRFVRERADGTVELPSGDTGTILGVAVKSDGLERSYPSGSAPSYKAGELVPVIQRGTVYVAFSGGTDAALGTVNVKNDAATPADKGKATGTATAAGTIRALGSNVRFVKDIASATLALVDLNMP